MNQLCVPVPSASDTHAILQEVFTLCRIPWIYDFIFRADPAADISMLLAPVQKRHALSARIFVHATETSSRYAHTFDFNKELMFYSIPAFSIGSITAGFCVEQPAHAAKRDDAAPDSLQCIRFIRDDRAGVFLHISENERTSVTEVDCLTHKSSTRRTRVRMKFDMHSLRTVLRTPRGILYPADIASSLIYLNVSDEKRSCPVCKDPTATHCSCTLPLRRPHHPLDFQFEASNMGLYTGFYQGATVVRLCSAGHCVINATLQSGSVIQGELNADITAKLHKMAVLDRLTRVKERPASLVMPASPLNLNAMLAAEAPEEVEALVEGVEQMPSKPEMLDSDGLFASEPQVTSADLDDSSGLMDTGDLLAGMDNVDNVCAEAPRIQAERADLNVLALQDRGPGGGGEEEDSSAVDDGNGCKVVNGGLGRSVETGNGDITGERSFLGRCPSWASRSSKRTELETEEKSSSPNGFGDEDMQMGAGGSQSSGAKSSGGGVDATTTATSGAVELDKAEIRKKRNREAAARSNLKRKLKNESVRRDLASLTQRAIRLRVKEMMLRDENTRLRTAVRRAATASLPKG